MRLALRAQSQARATVETLSVVKNPPHPTFIRQANVAHGPQQVNNAQPAPSPPGSRASEYKSQPNKLLEQHTNEWLDAGTSQASVGADPAMATLGQINGAKDDEGQG